MKLLVAIIGFAATAAFSRADTLIIQVNAFIQAPSVGVPTYHPMSVFSGQTFHGDGDNRTFNQNGSSRVAAGFVMSNNQYVGDIGPSAGQSTLRNASNAIVQQGYADTSNVHIIHWSNGQYTSVHIYGGASDPVVPFAPPTSFDFTIEVWPNPQPGGQPSVIVRNATHDAYPSFEVTKQWNGNAKSLVYTAAETNPNSMLIQPFRSLAGGQPPVSFTTYGVPLLQPAGTWTNNEFYVYWGVNGPSSSVPKEDDTTGVSIGEMSNLEYQDTSGNWHDWEN